MLERHSSIAAAVQHERGNLDSRQQLRDVDISEDAQKTNGRFGRSGDALQFIEPLHLLMRGIRDDKRREHLAGGGIVLPPSLADERDRCLCPGHIRRIAAQAPPLAKPPHRTSRDTRSGCRTAYAIETRAPREIPSSAKR